MSEIKTAKPEIEQVAEEVLSGEVLKNALDFFAYLRENKINPQWSATNAWKISYKAFSVCFIRLYGAADYYNLQKGSWRVMPFIGEYGESSLSGELREIVWAHKSTCRPCGKCALPLNHVFGKKYDYACEKAITFVNPDTKEIECVKKLIELRRNDIKEGNAKKHTYIAVRNR